MEKRERLIEGGLLREFRERERGADAEWLCYGNKKKKKLDDGRSLVLADWVNSGGRWRLLGASDVGGWAFLLEPGSR